MSRLLLSDEEWMLIGDLFPKPKETGRPPANPRTILDGTFWVLRTAAPWRDLPKEFGAYQTVWRYFDEGNDSSPLVKIYADCKVWLSPQICSIKNSGASTARS